MFVNYIYEIFFPIYCQTGKLFLFFFCHNLLPIREYFFLSTAKEMQHA